MADEPRKPPTLTDGFGDDDDDLFDVVCEIDRQFYVTDECPAHDRYDEESFP